MFVAPETGRYLVAAGWLAHAGWDVAHHHSGEVVPRSYSEFCGVFDVLVAVAVLLGGAVSL